MIIVCENNKKKCNLAVVEKIICTFFYSGLPNNKSYDRKNRAYTFLKLIDDRLPNIIIRAKILRKHVKYVL